MNPAGLGHTLKVTTPGDREVVMVRAFNASRDFVFDAFTKPELIQQWLLGPDGWSMPVCDVDLRVGGDYRYRWRNDTDGTEFGTKGTFREIKRAERIAHTEQFEGDPNEASVTTTFEERGGATTVTMRIAYPSHEVRDMVLATGMDKGVAKSYDRLAALLEKVPPA